ncbi:tRNA-splicing endonuclease subunit sen54 N-term-domain-containing protein [Polychytrium aggregatum]|uniref:tRNA-splicing endonuclease subunit sen54 N-term-domain-containing protein n=1 Tax=Polychytrium aggregatum TaxID=110093 RepID=UPI0022FDFB8D|nr:tRNA-splicing endonuclease subunit sen54 N-term-domain-containing protein [Polychytrium aggregatum]KAI9209055.1 tRNA-splicing endonuclease subunit sen54 N-term-domain-containing protein [Polychytrium aggregatum]
MSQPNQTADDDGEARDYADLLASRSHQLASIRRPKDGAPDPSSLEQAAALEQSRHALATVLAEERNTTNKQIAEGTLCPDTKLTHVPNNKGTLFRTMGQTIRGQLYLNPEEALWLAERGFLKIKHHGVGISIQHAWYLLLGDSDKTITTDQYLVYAYLRRLGYIVFRRSQCSPSPPASTLPSSPARPRALSSILLNWWMWHQDLVVSTCYRFFRMAGLRLPCRPLVLPGSLKSYDQVFDRIRIIDRLDRWTSRPAPKAADFVVWKPNPGFKKSNMGSPHFHIAVVNVADALFSMQDIQELASALPETAELKVAVVDHGNISFLDLSVGLNGGPPR